MYLQIGKAFAMVLIISILSGCNASDKGKVYSGTPLAGYVPVYLSDTCFAGSQDFFSLATVEAFYNKRSFRTAWSNNKKLNHLADSMLLLIRDAKYLGLRAQDYHLEEIESLLNLNANNKGDSFYLAQIDKLLTNSFFTMAYHLEKGRVNLINNKSFEKPLHADTLYIEILEMALQNNSLRSGLESLEPKHAPYISLKQALQKMIDKKSGKGTSGSMSGGAIVIEQEILLISVNMERWRQETKEFPEKYILVNIPSFHLNVMEGDSSILKSRVIVGKPSTSTPILNSHVECFTIYPYWTVPRSIATKELLPKIQKDPQFLEKQFYQVLDSKGNILDPQGIDWDALSIKNFPYVLRQTEGSYNAMGIVKFMFDNPYSVYLHDTNSRSLFKKENRALSHGCIRVEKWGELAQVLVHNDPVFQDPKTLQNMFKHQKRRTIDLIEPMAIYTRYYTAEVLGDSVYYYNDIYKKDEKIIQSLYKNHLL